MKQLSVLLLIVCFILMHYKAKAQQGSTCADPYVISSLPFSLTNMTTEGMGNDYSDADACNSSYMTGEDFVFEYTPAANQSISLALSNTEYGVGVFVTDACPDDPSANCITFMEAIAGNPVINDLSIQQGVTYYIIISTNDLWELNPTTAFDIEMWEVFQYDGGVTEIITPVSGYSLSANETVSVTL